eukprot:m.80125 g.80125  ORF g.80125 m.80125 type:complete len:394 (+) comp14825_c0_seq1:3608-4789(+)
MRATAPLLCTCLLLKVRDKHAQGAPLHAEDGWAAGRVASSERQRCRCPGHVWPGLVEQDGGEWLRVAQAPDAHVVVAALCGEQAGGRAADAELRVLVDIVRKGNGRAVQPPHVPQLQLAVERRRHQLPRAAGDVVDAGADAARVMCSTLTARLETVPHVLVSGPILAFELALIASSLIKQGRVQGRHRQVQPQGAGLAGGSAGAARIPEVDHAVALAAGHHLPVQHKLHSHDVRGRREGRGPDSRLEVEEAAAACEPCCQDRAPRVPLDAVDVLGRGPLKGCGGAGWRRAGGHCQPRIGAHGGDAGAGRVAAELHALAVLQARPPLRVLQHNRGALLTCAAASDRVLLHLCAVLDKDAAARCHGKVAAQSRRWRAGRRQQSGGIAAGHCPMKR